MTPKQQLYYAIRDFRKLNHYSPTVAELAEIMGHSSTYATRKALKSLEKKFITMAVEQISHGESNANN